MELVYLWVEEYKNIKEEGFNFSPRFTCNYDKDSKELTIDENKEYISIFPENINITAIVGENGSGKTTLLGLLNSILSKLNISIQTRYILLVNINEHIHYESNIENIEFQDYIEGIHNLTTLTHLHDISNKNYNEKNKKMDYWLQINSIMLEENEISQLLTMQLQEEYSFPVTSFLYFPIRMSIKPMDFSEMFDFIIYNDENDFKNSLDLSEAFYEITNIFHKFLFLIFVEMKLTDIDKLNNFDLLKQKFEETDFPNLSENKFNEMFIEKDFLIKDITQEERDFYIYFFNNYFEFNYYDSLDRDWVSLSSGEKTFFAIFLNIYYFNLTALKHNNKMVLTLDEIEISLHPNWQKSFLYELLNLLTNLNNNFHIVLSSHSPFILSDFIKENVIFLKEGKQVNVDIKPFGANIHTLLSHGFFMKDGLMGEFAKSKINEVIKILKRKIVSKKNLDYCSHIISLIGEPVLQKTLQTMLDEKIYSKENELQKLERKQKEIEEQIKSIKEQNEKG